MTCNRCSTVSNEAAKAVGAPEVEATWAENRDHPQFCPTCHGFLRRDGGCTKCENTGVGSDDEDWADWDSGGDDAFAPHPQQAAFESIVYLSRTWADIATEPNPAGRMTRDIKETAAILQAWKQSVATNDEDTSVDGFLNRHPGLRDPDSGPAYAARQAAMRLAESWQPALADGVSLPTLADDVDGVVAVFQKWQNNMSSGWMTFGRRENGRAKMAMAMPTDTAGIEMKLSCGHGKKTSVSPGSEEWCTECDDWVTVESPEPPPSSTPSPATTPIVPAVPRTTALSAPPARWSRRRKQLWNEMEKVAQGKGITAVEHWTGFADSSGNGNGKVYGGFYGRGKDGKWYSVIAYGPIERAKVKDIQIFTNEASARRHYQLKATEKLSGKYIERWPCDR